MSQKTNSFEAARLFEFGCRVVAECGRRDLRRWNRGCRILLHDGRELDANSEEFKNVLINLYFEWYKSRPSTYSIGRALAKLNRCNFINRELCQ